jgi:hypothetical protein
MFGRTVIHRSLICAAVVAAAPAAAFAQAMAGADTRNGSDWTNGLNATSRYFLHSNTTAPKAIGPNDDTSITNYPAAGGIVNVAANIPANPATVIDIAGKGGVITYSPIVMSNLVNKPATGSQRARDSSSGFNAQEVFYGSLATGGVSNNAQLTGFESTGQTFGGAAGTAASITYDPFSLSGPSIGYFPLNFINSDSEQEDTYTLSGTLSAPVPGDFAAMEFMVIDSRYEPDPSNLGDPANYLWDLTISEDGPATSVSDLFVSFDINPLATTAGGGALDALTDSSGDPLDPSDVLDRVIDALTVTNGAVTLSAVDPFPAGTEYQVPFGTTITYGGANGAAVTQVASPEPGSFALVFAGAVAAAGGLVGRRRRPREVVAA